MYDGHMTRTPARIGSRPLTESAAGDTARIFAALSDPVRLRLFDLVRRAGSSGICSCDLTGPLERSQPTVSHHLKVLREAGLVDSRRDGTWIWYSVPDGVLAGVAAFIGR